MNVRPFACSSARHLSALAIVLGISIAMNARADDPPAAKTFEVQYQKSSAKDPLITNFDITLYTALDAEQTEKLLRGQVEAMAAVLPPDTDVLATAWWSKTGKPGDTAAAPMSDGSEHLIYLAKEKRLLTWAEFVADTYVPQDPTAKDWGTRGKYRKITTGMSYANVALLLNDKGREIARGNPVSANRQTYLFQHQDGKGFQVTVEFEDKKVISKAMEPVPRSVAPSERRSRPAKVPAVAHLEKYEKIYVGMDEDSLFKLLGHPDSMTKSDGTGGGQRGAVSRCIWTAGGTITVYLIDGKVTKKSLDQ